MRILSAYRLKQFKINALVFNMGSQFVFRNSAIKHGVYTNDDITLAKGPL